MFDRERTNDLFVPSQPSKEPGSQLLSQSLNSSQGENHERAGVKKIQKTNAVDWFLQNAPKATEWRTRQTKLELNTVEQYEEVIRAFTNRSNVIAKREPLQGDEHSRNELVDLAEKFALLTRDSFINAKLQKAFARFQALILLSYCKVLRKRGVPYDTVDQIIQHISERKDDRKRLLASALWVNGVIVDLVSHGWTIYRATELFFIGVFSGLPTCDAELTSFLDALSLFYLTHIHTDKNSKLILEHLKTDKFVKHDYSDCLGPRYTIPGLIASLLDAGNITANKLSYGFRSVNSGSTDELGSVKYGPPLVTLRIACQSQSRAYTEFIPPLLQLILISRSWCQAPSKAMMGLRLQVRSSVKP